jgi:hypothetical protein
MIAPPPTLDLDDAASLEAADTPGVLRSAATAGAQVRATAAAVAEDALARLVDLRPRSVVVVTGAGRAYRAAALLVAALAGQSGLPIAVAATTPPWAGPLDVVVVTGDDAGDPRLADAVDRAVRRGAEVVVATPDEGPVRAAAAGRAMLLPPRVPVLDQNTLLRHLSVGMAVLAMVDPAHSGHILPDLHRLADALDAEAIVDHPRNEVFHNPAKALAARMQRHRVVFTGDTAATAELAAHAAEVLLRVAGSVSAALPLSEVVAAAPEFGASSATGEADYDPLFHDEELDGPAPRDPIRVFALTTDPDHRAAQRRVAVLPDADLVTASAGLDDSARQPAGPEAGELEQLAVLALRLEMAAAYAKLTGGGLA